MGIEYVVNEGDGAFYGPKIDFHLTDCLWSFLQCGTIQLDFQLPHNFQLEYILTRRYQEANHDSPRAGFGSFERFIGILTENYVAASSRPLSPCQVKVLLP